MSHIQKKKTNNLIYKSSSILISMKFYSKEFKNKFLPLGPKWTLSYTNRGVGLDLKVASSISWE